ncbi:MAG: LLM class flavin-dependent oxidoreductase [Actinobacteria bacterium]|nr:LLM class flavin-dependent oxidoreductase [Actinomycetota bacterium]
MEFGYFFTMYNLDHRPYGKVMDRAAEQTVLAEQLGFDCVWSGEHHFGGEGYDIHPNPILTGTMLAAATERIRIGLAAVILPGWHPLRLAEDIAILDHYSGGRLECGVGRGITNREMSNLSAFDVDRRYPETNWAIFLETLEILRRAWTDDPFRWDGDFYTFPRPGVKDSYADWYPRNPSWRSEDGEYVGMSIVPKPLQNPHPPLWNVLDSTPSFVVAAEQGLKPITWLRSEEALQECFAKYREVAAEVQGRSVGLGEDCAVLRVCFLAGTMQEARRIAEPAVERLFRDYIGGLRSRQIYAEPDETLSDEELARPWFDFLFDRGHLIVGTPEFAIERIHSMRERIGLENLLILSWLPGLEEADIRRSIEMFGDKVIPAFQGG